MRSRLTRSLAPLRRNPWFVGLLALEVGTVAAIPVALDPQFYRALIATYIGAALGFLVAIYVDRLQRSEDEEARRSLDHEADQRGRVRDAGIARSRRVAVLSLLRTELGQVPDQMAQSYRQNRSHVPPTSDRLTDILWRSLSLSGELRWIEDLGLLQQIASAYDLLAVEIGLEKQWSDARAVAGAGKVVTEDSIAHTLKIHDFHLWTGACRACKAMDVALKADGAEVGGSMFCPHG
jgi:hypothetical protein